MKGARSLLGTVCLLGAAGCAGGAGIAGVSGDPYVRGPVMDIAHSATRSGVRVDAGPGSREPCGIMATVDDATRYYRRVGAGELSRARVADLEIGDTVEVYVQGPIAESCPVQAYAAAIVMVR